MKQVAVIIGSRSSDSLDQGAGPRIMPASDRAAIGMGVALVGAKVAAWSPDADPTALAYALGAGAGTANILHDPADVSFDLAIVGGAGCGEWGDLLPALLAEKAKATLVLEVTGFAWDADARSLRVTRDLGRGATEILEIAGPAVLQMSEAAGGVPYVSVHRRTLALRFLAKSAAAPETLKAVKA